jgi:hypothetical protein
MGASDFECSPKSSDGVTMEKVRNEDIVCLHSFHHHIESAN